MYVIVTQLSLSEPLGDDFHVKVESELAPAIREDPGFDSFQFVSVSDTEAILLVFFTTREALDRVSSDIAGPWFAENVRAYLAGPVRRSVGEVVSTVTRA